MNKEEKIVIGSFVAIGVVLLAILYFENKKLSNENKKLEEDNLKLILDALKTNSDVSEEIKKQLNELVKKFETVNPKVSKEIKEALLILQIGVEKTAIFKLSKIIENLLIELYKNDIKYKNWDAPKGINKNDYSGYLYYCYKIDSKINQIEHDFIKATKTVRNKEGHEYLELQEGLQIASFLIVIEAIIKLSEFVYNSIS